MLYVAKVECVYHRPVCLYDVMEFGTYVQIVHKFTVHIHFLVLQSPSFYLSLHPFLPPSQMVQKLVEERLRVLELTVFDRSLKELKERVEKIDCATKHQGTLNTLQVRHSNI